MSVYTAIKAVLAADATVLGLVGTRVSQIELPRNPTFPAITLHGIASPPRTPTHDGKIPMDRTTVQVSCWAASPETAVTLARAVQDALHGYRGAVGAIDIQAVIVQSSPDANTEENNEIGIYHTPIDFEVHYYG